MRLKKTLLSLLALLLWVGSAWGGDRITGPRTAAPSRGPAPGKSALLAPLKLSAGEQADLVAFLNSLSGTVPVVKPPPLP